MRHDPARSRLPRELRATVLLSAPLVVGQLSSMGMNVVDTVLAGRHGTTTLAAIGVGAPAWSVVILLCIGVLMAVPPTVAHLVGAGRREAIGAVARQALWLALALGLALFAAMRVAPSLLARFIAPDVMPGVAGFVHGISWGAPALALYLALRYVAEGVAWTVPTMLIGTAGLGLLLPLGWALMDGWGPLPEWGAAGLGLATAIVLWAQVAAMAATLARSRRCADLGLFTRFDAPDPAAIGQLLRLGVPMGIAIFMEGSLFVATALLIATLGTLPIAAHQVAILAASAAFMVPLGVAMGTTVRVGQAAGAGDAEGVRWAARAGWIIGGATQTVSALVLALAGAWIAGLITDDPAVIAAAAVLMLFAAVFQYTDGLQAISAGALRGLKDTRIPAWITVFSYWGVGLPVGVVLGGVGGPGGTIVFGLGWGPSGYWPGLILGLSVAAVLLTGRFLSRSSRDLRPVT
ncbi:MAG: MATE family efflux transporter [Xanthomonadaceae bacterium]|jgi:MATE family multidrug resistance protein|nr:MATE family efflux transporter [Xanthomonadaceae bacterium]